MENNARRLLFGTFPRTVASKNGGELKQHFVHSSDELELFFGFLQDKRDLYSSICHFDPQMNPIVGDVAFDFDSPMKDAFWSEDIPESEKIQQMREDEDVAHTILGPVWDDAQSLVQKCCDENIPVITVFSGMGVHCHLLYEPEFKPEDKKISTSKWLIEECDLDTWDRQILTDLRRVLRIPNSKRFNRGEFTGVYNIPITEKEVLNNSVTDLLERSRESKDIPNFDRYHLGNRPEMQMMEGYEDVEETNVTTKNISEEESIDVGDGITDLILEECIPMPCIREHFKTYNPDNEIRLFGVIHLLNAGFSVNEVVDIISKLGWKDFRRSITEEKVKDIYRKGYSDPNCSTLMKRGYCVYKKGIDGYPDDDSECPTKGWSNGQAEWVNND